jgi:hypothetical protein
MTGRYAYSLVRAEMAKAGKAPSRLPPDVFMEILNRAMQDVNDEAHVFVARDISFTISPTTGRFVRVKVGNVAVRMLSIIRASYCTASTPAEPIRVEQAFQSTGPDGASATVETGPPAHCWIEPDNYGGVVAPASDQIMGFKPTPDQAYVIHLAAKLVLPDYANWLAELPVQVRAHKVVVDTVLAKLFAMRDFHDNAMKGHYLQLAQVGILRLQTKDVRQAVAPEVPFDEENWTQVE